MVSPTALFHILAIPVLLYTAAITIFTAVIHRKRTLPNQQHYLPVSVVIPFRNEAANIANLLESLCQQNYPQAFELIFIDDNSSDKGREILKEMAKKLTAKIEILSLQLDPEKNLTSKQQALDYGVQQARFPVIVFTDADMVFDENWLKDLAGSLSPQRDLVFGHTSIVKTNPTSLFQRLEAFQLELLFSFAFAFDKANLCGSGMGNNIVFKKEKYILCGGQVGIGYSIVEDRELISLFQKKGCSTAAQTPFIPKAYTYPCSDFKQFSNQLRRWAVGGLNLNSNLLPFALLFFTQNLLLLLGPFGVLPPILLIPLLLNFFLTWFFTLCCFKKNGSKESALLFPVYYIFLIVEILLWAVKVILRQKIRWKERTL